MLKNKIRGKHTNLESFAKKKKNNKKNEDGT